MIRIHKYDVVLDTFIGEKIIKSGFHYKRTAESFRTRYKKKLPKNLQARLKVVESSHFPSEEIKDAGWIESRKDVSKSWGKVKKN
jgi:hypothetical protein